MGEWSSNLYREEGMALHPPPNLPAMSTTLAPQMPLLPTTTVSPGSTKVCNAGLHACADHPEVSA